MERKYKLFIVCLTLLSLNSACTKKANDPVAISDLPKANQLQNQNEEKNECDPLMMSSDKPSAVWKMKNNQYLIVCNLGDFNKINDNRIKGWVNIYQRPISHQKRFIKEVDSELPSSHVTFEIEKKSDTTILITKYIKDPKSSFEESYDVAATQYKIDCSKSTCTTTSEVCIYKKPTRPVDTKLIDYVKNISQGKETNLEKFGYYDVVIDNLTSAALRGDKRAKKLVLETSRDKLKVDGASAESFSDGYRILSNLVNLGCMKK